MRRTIFAVLLLLLTFAAPAVAQVSGIYMPPKTTFESAFSVQPLAAPSGISVTCNTGASGTTINRYFQLTTFDAAAAESLPSAEVSVLACPDDSTITVDWTPAPGGAGVAIYVSATTGAKTSRYDYTEASTATSLTFTILTGEASPNLTDDLTTGVSLPTVATASGNSYDFASGTMYGSDGYFNTFAVPEKFELGVSGLQFKSGTGVPTANCVKGDLWYRTDGGSSSSVYSCYATNTWSPMVDVASTVPVDVAHDAANFTGKGTLTWTVEAGDQTAFDYTIVGKLMIINWWLVTTATSTGGATDNQIRITLPAGKTCDKRSSGVYYYADTSSGVPSIATFWICSPGTTYLGLYYDAGTQWPTVAGTLNVYGQAVISIQ